MIHPTPPSKGIQISESNGWLTVENQAIRRRFRTVPDFRPVSLFNKITQTEILTESTNWFEFGINDSLLTSAQFVNWRSRPLKNGGEEILAVLAAPEIKIEYTLRIFPNCPVTRERLVLTPAGDSFRMTFYQGQMHAIFPKYSLAGPANWELEEIRLASWNREQLPDANVNAFPLNRHWGETDARGLNLSQCDMYHPAFLPFAPREKSLRKGPIMLGTDLVQRNWILAYEHGSPDNDSSKDFLQIGSEPVDKNLLAWVAGRKGTYFHNEIFSHKQPFATVWVDFGSFHPSGLDFGHKTFRDFLFFWQSENQASRRPLIYYNTWGWQREEEHDYLYFEPTTDTRTGLKLYGDATVYPPVTYFNMHTLPHPRRNFAPDEVPLNEPRLLREIEFAHEIGANVFVLDDGWYDWMGDWELNSRLGAAGFSRMKAKLDALGMRLGLWLAPICIDAHAKIFKNHPEFLARDEADQIRPSRFGRNLGCLLSPGYATDFIRKCKKLIDSGCTYFKWDALDGWLCHAAGHGHGDAGESAAARGERYGYEFVRMINSIAQELTTYCPGLVIVYDVTETGRFVGLDFLSQGRFFWMNNGASGYYDQTNLRAQSLRTIYNQYHSILPTALQTSAQYPHDRRTQPKQRRVHGSQDYKIYSTLVGGNGFWGDLGKMEPDERQNVREIVSRYKRVATTVFAVQPRVVGKIGGSPEIYEFIDSAKAEGQVIAFSSSVRCEKYFTQTIDPERFLGVLNHAYQSVESRLQFDFEFTEPDSARAAFILGQNQLGARIDSSTCWLKDIRIEDAAELVVRNGAPGEISIFWPTRLGVPEVQGIAEVVFFTVASGVHVQIRLAVGDLTVRLRGR